MKITIKRELPSNDSGKYDRVCTSYHKDIEYAMWKIKGPVLTIYCCDYDLPGIIATMVKEI